VTPPSVKFCSAAKKKAGGTMTTNVSKAAAAVRSAVRVYLIVSGLMFLGGAVVGAALAMAGYTLPDLY
jgi:hypothetical protein